ncbi:tyrosine-type recombinase/integrase [Candidatus Poribacteria bacterium]|nr:tyrosine-type recombinase/integrase [Candidatus Poribacteria bacterium]
MSPWKARRSTLTWTMSFKRYRQAGGYSESSIKVQDSHISQLLSWCTLQSIEPQGITYNQVLEFIDHQRKRGIKHQSIAGMVNSIRIYFDYLVEIGCATHNVFRRIRLRQAGRRALPQVLSQQQLEKIYQAFANLPLWHHRSSRARLIHQRDTVVLGLMIFQGLDSGQLSRLEPAHLNLEKGTLYVPSGRKSNARILDMHTMQVLAMKTYLDKTRPQLIQMQKQDPGAYLFMVKKPGEMVARIMRGVKRIDPQVTGSRQIRSSVIMGWLKRYNIRQVQYMAGHKSIRTTESYRLQDLTDLTRQLELFHPLR